MTRAASLSPWPALATLAAVAHLSTSSGSGWPLGESLTYANLIPASLTGLIVSRDLFLVYAGLYIRYMSVVPPFTLQKYFDPTLPTATVQPTTISKADM